MQRAPQSKMVLEQSRSAVVRAAICFMTAAYWEIGHLIVEFEQGGKKRANYGAELLKRLSHDLTAHRGRGFSVDNLERFRQFYLIHPPMAISATVSRKSGSTSGTLLLAEMADRKSATLSRKFPAPNWVKLLQVLAARFPLPWSNYVRLLSVRTRRRPFTKPKPCAAAGACASPTVR